jgi:hypothetical protein
MTDVEAPEEHSGLLSVTMGSCPRVSLSVKHDGQTIVLRRSENLQEVRIGGWRAAAVITRLDGQARYWEIAPGPELSEISLLPTFVRGRFRVVHQSNNPAEARESFKAFVPGAGPRGGP